MRKKILYGILFLTLFFVSTVSMALPVQAHAYERGIPDEALGVELVSEVKIFNEDAWEESLGKGVNPSDIYDSKGSGADKVGARTSSIIREFEDDEELKIFPKKLYGNSGTAAGDMNVAILGAFAALALNPLITGFAAPLLYMLNASAWGAAGGLGMTPSIASAANLTSLMALAGPINNVDENNALYSTKFDGTYMRRDKWFYDDDWETDEDFGKDNPDFDWDDSVDGWGPVFYDPRDRYELFERLRALKAQTQADIAAWDATVMNFFVSNFFQGAASLPAAVGPITLNFTSYTAIQDYIKLNTTLGGAGATAFPTTIPFDWTALGVPGADAPVSAVHDCVMGTIMMLDIFISSFYHMAGILPFDNKYAMFALWGAQGLMPIPVPVEDYVPRMVKEFNFKEDVLVTLPWVSYGADTNGDGIVHPAPTTAQALYFPAPVGGETVYTQGYMNYEVEGTTVVCEIEYLDNTYDPKDVYKADLDPDELDDWEFTLTFADVGGCGCAWTSGDTILYQTGGVDQIPGYEIPILLTASAVSILALVYVIMKKRKK